jgi:hypothetical protein
MRGKRGRSSIKKLDPAVEEEEAVIIELKLGAPYIYPRDGRSGLAVYLIQNTYLRSTLFLGRYLSLLKVLYNM